MPDLTIALVQTALAWEDIDANLRLFDRWLERIEIPCDVIMLPEMFSTGFSMSAERLAEPMSGKAVTWLRERAAAKGAVIAGSLMIRDDGRFFNRLVWAQPGGAVLAYDKKHLFAYAGEHKVYTAGSRCATFEINGWRLRPFICYDLRFPVWCRNLDLAYDLAFFVANWPAKRAAHWQTLLRARAIENQAFVVGVNRVGTDGLGYPYRGDSAVIDPMGTVMFEQAWQESLHIVRLERRLLDDYRAAFPAWKDQEKNFLNSPPAF